jgi:hypothetical protein
VSDPRPPEYCDLVDELEELKAQLAATHAAIRALPRYRVDSMFPGVAVLDTANGTLVKFDALARLLGDPAQEHP